MKTSKRDPSIDLLEDIRDTDRGKNYFQSVRKRTQRDDQERQGYLEKLDHYRARRYCMEDRDPVYPWPGSSSIVLPFIDKFIDQIKPAYVNLVAGAKPPCTALSADPEALKKVGNVELFLSWLVQFGSPLFLDQVILAADDCLEKGRCILKTVWHYETIREARILDRSRLSSDLKRILVTDTPEQASIIMRLVGGPKDPGGKAALSSEEFRRRLPQIRAMICQDLGLDVDDDAAAIAKIANWLKSGTKDKLRVDANQVRYNVPGIIAVDPRDLIVPTYSRSSLESCESYSEVMRVTKLELDQMARDGEWNKEAVKNIFRDRENQSTGQGNKVRGGGATSRWRDTEEANREGVTSFGMDTYEIFVTYGWYGSDGEPQRKTKLVWSDASPDIPLKFNEFVRPSGEWPHKSAVFELNKDRWYSARGIPEKLDDVDWEITHNHRFKLNRQMMETALNFVFRPGGITNFESFRFIPGQGIPAQNPNLDLRVLEIPPMGAVFEREEQGLRTWGEDYMGSADYALSQGSQLSEPRTRYEIESINSRAREALSLRGRLFQTQLMQPVYRDMLDLQLAYGEERIWLTVTNSDPIALSKEDLRGQFVLQCTGTIGEQDPAAEEQKSLARINVLTQVAPLLGAKYEIDFGEAVRDWLEKSDIRLCKLILHQRTPEEIQQYQQQQEEMLANAQIAQASGAQGGRTVGQASPPAQRMLPMTSGGSR